MKQYTDQYRKWDEDFAAQQKARFGSLPTPTLQEVHVGPLAIRIQHLALDELGLMFCVGKAMVPYDNSKPRPEIVKKAGYRLWKLHGIPNHKGIQQASPVKEIHPDDPKIMQEGGDTTIYKIDLEDQKLIAQ